jgi:hypothetical protein
MKVRDSGMPEEEWWSTFFDPERILRLFGLDGKAGKPGGGVRRNFPIGERVEGNDKKNGS